MRKRFLSCFTLLMFSFIVNSSELIENNIDFGLLSVNKEKEQVIVEKNIESVLFEINDKPGNEISHQFIVIKSSEFFRVIDMDTYEIKKSIKFNGKVITYFIPVKLLVNGKPVSSSVFQSGGDVVMNLPDSKNIGGIQVVSSGRMKIVMPERVVGEINATIRFEVWS
ncbi:hypothetical protein ACOMICROBIO_GDFFDHBD_02997 [Vibrio sp. B1REV9]|uniref:DUF5462 family protein n=1 Tax=Vibrio sp. B1REV9 TaxID=2751179 RepID=UPI001AF32280|nr:DUF5462 family protein [Vibrio sp. B1REV9]CAE6937619.1 hypothetical protein ACOMICROBIO_GDFFDHBD_02997 [Vibrio sp. B1REV9]